MSAQRLTPRQQKMLRACSGTFEAARDIAGRAEVDSRTAGAVLTSLEQKGLVEHRPGPFTNASWYRKPNEWRRVL